MNYYLKADSETALWQALEAAGLATKDYDPEDPLNVHPDDAQEDWEPTGDFTHRFTGIALDIIGVIQEPTGNTLTDDEGNEYPEMTPIPGFHANLIADSAAGLPTIEAPSSPYRVWAGQEI